MKALISPNETFNYSWISSWVWVEATQGATPTPGYWNAVYSEIIECQRVAEVEKQIFEVALPLHWVDCPEDCVADQWYFKNGQCFIKPQDAPMPPTPVEVLP